MMRIPTFVCYIFAGLTFPCIVSCSREPTFSYAIPESPLDLERRVDPYSTGTNELQISQMADTDIIVCVNGYPLRKKVFDDLLVLRAKGLMESKKENPLVVQKRIEEARKRLPAQFVSQRLMIDDALSNRVATVAEVRDHLQSTIRSNVCAKGEGYLKKLDALKGSKAYLFYEMSAAYVMDKLVKERIPPCMEVDQDFVKAVQEQVRVDNEATARTNAMIKARLQNLKAKIARKEANFIEVAKKFSQSIYSGADDTVVLEKSEIEDKALAYVVFSLKSGEVSDVIEDDEGFHLVKVIKIIPPVRDEQNGIAENERREICDIYIEKLPLLMRQDDIHMSADLRNQIQMHSINCYLEVLQTNGNNTVVFPHGRNLFK